MDTNMPIPMNEVLQAAFKGNTEELFIPSRFLSKMFTTDDNWPNPSMLCKTINDDKLYALRLSDGTFFQIPCDKTTGKTYIAVPIPAQSGENGIILKKNNPSQGQPTMAEILNAAYLNNKTRPVFIPYDFMSTSLDPYTRKGVILGVTDRINTGKMRSIHLIDKSYFKFPHECYVSAKAETSGIMLYITHVDKNISISIKGSKSPNGAIAYTIQCTGDSCIDSLRKTIARIEASTDFKIMFNNVYLEDDSKTLKEVGITHGSVISVVWLNQIKAKARSILNTWLSTVRAKKHTEEQRLIKLRDQAAAIMMEKDIGHKQIYVFLENRLEELYERAREIRGRMNDIMFEMQTITESKLDKSKARLQWEYNELRIELVRLVGIQE